MQAAETPNTESDIHSNGTISTITVKKKGKLIDCQNANDFCIIIYKWIILSDLKVMKDRKGKFRKGFLSLLKAKTTIFVFYEQKTLFFRIFDIRVRST